MRNSYTRTDGAHRRISQLRYTRIHQLEINWTTPHKNCVDNWPDSYRSFGRKPAADRAGFSCSSGLLLVDHKQSGPAPPRWSCAAETWVPWIARGTTAAIPPD